MCLSIYSQEVLLADSLSSFSQIRLSFFCISCLERAKDNDIKSLVHVSPMCCVAWYLDLMSPAVVQEVKCEMRVMTISIEYMGSAICF